MLKDKTSCCLSADALSVLSGITIRCQDCLEDLQQIADSVDLEASLHKPLKSERKDDVRIAALTSAAHSPAISPNEKRRAWRPTGKSGSTSSSAEHGANLAERIKWIISRPKSGLVRQELDTIFTFLQLMVAIIESAHRMKKGRYVRPALWLEIEVTNDVSVIRPARSVTMLIS